MRGSPFAAGASVPARARAPGVVAAEQRRPLSVGRRRWQQPSLSAADHPGGSLKRVGRRTCLLPVSIAVFGPLVYVANAGTTGSAGETNYTGFTLNRSGHLRPLGDSTVTLPGTSQPGDVLFTPDGQVKEADHAARAQQVVGEPGDDLPGRPTWSGAWPRARARAAVAVARRADLDRSRIGAERVAPGAVANVPALRRAARRMSEMLGQLGAERRLDHWPASCVSKPLGPVMSSGSRPLSASAGRSSASRSTAASVALCAPPGL
jgi:hypothetical protein